MKNHCLVLLTSADSSNLYDRHKLGFADQQRIQQFPQLAQRLDWQNSRFLKQQLPSHYSYTSLTHKNGCAALIASASCCPLGIDLEYVQQRDFLALSTLCCSELEQEWLTQQQDLATSFYQLWTLKEALIKAHHGQLSDLCKWSLIQPAKSSIHIPTLQLQAYTAVIKQSWFLSVVYPAIYTDVTKCTQIFGAWNKHDIIWHRWPNHPSV